MFAHINEQILQIAVAGSCVRASVCVCVSECMCVCVSYFGLKSNRKKKKELKYQKWALSDVMQGWQLAHTSFQIYSVHAVV